MTLTGPKPLNLISNNPHLGPGHLLLSSLPCGETKQKDTHGKSVCKFISTTHEYTARRRENLENYDVYGGYARPVDERRGEGKGTVVIIKPMANAQGMMRRQEGLRRQK